MQGEIYTFKDDRKREADEALARAMELRRLREVIARDLAAELDRREAERAEEASWARDRRRSRVRGALEALGVAALGLGTLAVGIYMLWRAQ